MSVWNDSGAGNSPGAGGTGGSSTSAQGGAGGQGGVGAGTTSVTGGIRDVATAQCISGGSCPVSGADLSCIKGNCGASLTTCYSASGTAGGGACVNYAKCMLQCPCDAGKSKCEGDCVQNYISADRDCMYCIVELGSCASKFSCPMATSC